jgi:hypothetical protein
MMPWLRTELRMAVVLRSRPLGPMLTPPAGELWPLCVRIGPRTAFFLRGSSISYIHKSKCTTTRETTYTVSLDSAAGLASNSGSRSRPASGTLVPRPGSGRQHIAPLLPARAQHLRRPATSACADRSDRLSSRQGNMGNPFASAAIGGESGDGELGDAQQEQEQVLRTAASSARFFLAALPRLESNFEARWLMPWFGELPYHPVDGELADAQLATSKRVGAWLLGSRTRTSARQSFSFCSHTSSIQRPAHGTGQMADGRWWTAAESERSKVRSHAIEAPVPLGRALRSDVLGVAYHLRLWPA